MQSIVPKAPNTPPTPSALPAHTDTRVLAPGLSPAEMNAFEQLLSCCPPPEPERRGHRGETRVIPVAESVRVRAIRYALAMWAGSSSNKALAQVGADWGTISLARVACPDVRRVLNFAQAEHQWIMALKAESQLESIIDGESEEKVNIRAVMFALERLNKRSYADARGKRVDDACDGAPAQVVYNININQAAAPQCENRPTGQLLEVANCRDLR